MRLPVLLTYFLQFLKVSKIRNQMSSNRSFWTLLKPSCSNHLRLMTTQFFGTAAWRCQIPSVFPSRHDVDFRAFEINPNMTQLAGIPRSKKSSWWRHPNNNSLEMYAVPRRRPGPQKWNQRNETKNWNLKTSHRLRFPPRGYTALFSLALGSLKLRNPEGLLKNLDFVLTFIISTQMWREVSG